MLKIEINKQSYLPGEKISGKIFWSLENYPSHIDLKLFWYTGGKGTVDVEVIDTVFLEKPPIEGKKDFSFTLPLIPHSFSGKLISLNWALEIIVEPSGESEKLNFTVSLYGSEIIIENNKI